MRFRNVALLATSASILPFVYNAIALQDLDKSTSLSFTALLRFYAKSTSLGTLAVVLFLFFLGAEASGRINAKARANAAIVASILMMLDAAALILRTVLYILAAWTVPSLRYSAQTSVVDDLLHLIWNSLWIAFLIAFSAKEKNSRVIPRVAGGLCLLILAEAVRSSLQTYNASQAGWNYPVLIVLTLFDFGAFLLFYAVVWKKWNPDFTIHQNVVA